MLPQFAVDVARFPGASQYRIQIEVVFDPSSLSAVISGESAVRYTHPGGEALEEMAFMLWPQDEQYCGEMQIGQVLVDGRPRSSTAELGGQALRIALEPPLRAGEAISVVLPFEIAVCGPIGGAQPQRFGITEGVLIAPTFYPILPRMVAGYWLVEDAPPGGDTTTSDSAFYEVEISYPASLGLAASGSLVQEVELADGRARATFVSGPMRDFAFALGAFERFEKQVGEVLLRAWLLPQHGDDAQRLLNAAAEQMALFERLVGPYPFRELDLVDAPGAFAGIEYPGLIYLGTLGTPWLIEPTVHEVAHQWFYSLVGSDQIHEPWLDEALATYGEVLYLEYEGRAGDATGLLTSFRNAVRLIDNNQLPIGLALGGYPSADDYAVIVYYKGALFFDALRMEIGDRAFFEFLPRYFSAARYGMASGELLQESAEQSCGCDLDSLFDLWVRQGGKFPGQ